MMGYDFPMGPSASLALKGDEVTSRAKGTSVEEQLEGTKAPRTGRSRRRKLSCVGLEGARRELQSDQHRNRASGTGGRIPWWREPGSSRRLSSWLRSFQNTQLGVGGEIE